MTLAIAFRWSGGLLGIFYFAFLHALSACLCDWWCLSATAGLVPIRSCDLCRDWYFTGWRVVVVVAGRTWRLCDVGRVGLADVRRVELGVQHLLWSTSGRWRNVDHVAASTLSQLSLGKARAFRG